LLQWLSVQPAWVIKLLAVGAGLFLVLILGLGLGRLYRRLTRRLPLE